MTLMWTFWVCEASLLLKLDQEHWLIFSIPGHWVFPVEELGKDKSAVNKTHPKVLGHTQYISQLLLPHCQELSHMAPANHCYCWAGMGPETNLVLWKKLEVSIWSGTPLSCFLFSSQIHAQSLSINIIVCISNFSLKKCQYSILGR